MACLNAKPSIRIELGSFIGCYQGEAYVLGPVKIGLKEAVRQVLMIKREDRTWLLSKETAQTAIQDFFRIRERLQAGL